MGLRAKAFKASAVLAGGEAIGYGASFVRNMILARILTKADFGIAATLAMAISLLEFSAKLGVARFVVRDKEGDGAEFVAAAHMVQAVSSILSSLLTLAAAWPLAALFGLREHVASLLVLALIPLLHGMGHLDVRRQERHLRFAPSMWTETVPQLVITALAWPIGIWLADYRAVLILLILKALLTCLASHWLAEKPYRWSFHRGHAGRMIRFGWPMIVNGFLMFFVLRGDQFLVASFYSMSDLGAFAAAASLTTAPTLVFSRVFASIMLPLMARVQDESAAFNRRYGLVIALISSFTTAYASMVILSAEILMRLAFGAKYAGTGAILGWLTAANGIRNIRLATAIAAMAKGDSVNEMVSNVAGAVSLALALAIAVNGHPVWLVAGASCLGGIVACVVSFYRLSKRDGVPLASSLRPLILVALFISLAGGLAFLLREHAASWLMAALAVLCGALMGGFVLAILRDSRQECALLWSRRESLPLWGWLTGLRSGGRNASVPNSR